MQVGLDVLRRDGRIFECYGDMADTIFHSELGASNAVLAANFTIDSLMLRYQGVDWTDTANWKCNAGCGSQCIYGIVLPYNMCCAPCACALDAWMTWISSTQLIHVRPPG